LADLRETVGLTRLAETLLLHVEAAVRSSCGALLLNGRILASRHAARAEIIIWAKTWSPADGTALDCDGEDPLFPCRVPLRLEGAGLIGWLLVGRRPDGSPQGADEREALAASAGAIARALWVVARQEKEAAARDDLAARLRILEGARPTRAPLPSSGDCGQLAPPART
jgi:hypothetical protein